MRETRKEQRKHMSAIEATIQITVDWLVKHKPVVYTGRTKDQPLMAVRPPPSSQ